MKKILFQIILCILVTIGSAQPARADYWGAAEIEGVIDRALTWMKDNIDGIVLGVAKSALASVMNTQIADLVGGGSGGRPQFVTNWSEFMIIDTTMRASVYTEDFLTHALGGRGSSDYDPYKAQLADCYNKGTNCDSNYAYTQEDQRNRQAWLSKEGVVAGEWTGGKITTTQKCAGNGCLASQNYYAYLKDIGDKAIQDSNWSIIPGETRKISGVSDIDGAFSDWRGFSSIFSDDLNNPFGVAAKTQEVYSQKRADEQLVAMTEAISGNGYLSVKDATGNVKTPGITIGDAYNAISKFNFDNVASAEKISEVAIAAATNFATSYITNLATQGLNKASQATGINVGAWANTAWNEYNNDDDPYKDVHICDPGSTDPACSS